MKNYKILLLNTQKYLKNLLKQVLNLLYNLITIYFLFIFINNNLLATQ